MGEGDPKARKRQVRILDPTMLITFVQKKFLFLLDGRCKDLTMAAQVASMTPPARLLDIVGAAKYRPANQRAYLTMAAQVAAMTPPARLP
jgi:hypothetical protein